MNRIDRISAILIQLQSRRVVKAQEIADRFEISLRTVYRDMKTLEEAGIPIIGEAGVGYSIMDGYRLPPVMFTKQEATAFLTAEKFVEKLTDTSTANHYRSAMFKVRAVLKSQEKDMLESMDGNIEVFKGHHNMPMADNDHIQTILNSIAGKKVLTIEYFAHHSQEITRREIEPVGIFFLETFWHLIAYCRLRDDYRDFRIDRIRQLQFGDKKFENQHPTLKTYIAQTAREKHLETVIIRVEQAVYPMLSQQKYYSGFFSEHEVDGMVEMTFLSSSVEMFARWLVMFGDSAEIIAPDILRERVFDIASSVLKKLENTVSLLT
jgi:predicted DNA-binding transcriptional regulator YafY